MRLRSRQTRTLAVAAVAAMGIPLALVSGPSAQGQLPQAGQENSFPTMKQAARAGHEAEGPAYQKARERYLESRYLAGTNPLSPELAARYRNAAAVKAGRFRHVSGTTSNSLTTVQPPSWSDIGPHPVRQLGRTTVSRQSVTGRISALAVSTSGMIYAGGAQGGLWRYDPGTGQWTSLTDNLPTLAVGAVALAPHHENIIYLATGEGDLSGDSYTGDGIWKSTDSGATWVHISGAKFIGATVSRLVVDPSNPNKVYIATIRGRGGIRRVTPPTNQTWGVYRSVNGGKYWQLLKGTKDPNHGATDVELDPNHPGVLYATFWNDGLYKSNSGGTGWVSLNSKLAGAISPAPDFSASRMSITTADLGSATRIYAGFDWYNSTNGAHRASRLFRSDNGGATWVSTGYAPAGTVDSVLNYCDIQCTYDNVVEVDPSNPNTVYAAGEYNYAFELGGIYRSTDAGATWKTLGVDLHPDFHALAFQPGAPNHIVIGNDGGVWDSTTRGGRNGAGDLSSDPPQWNNLNNGGLSIAQFDSIDFANAAQGDDTVFWGGTQDNGTQARFFGDSRWYDMTSGDGGQVVVDHSNDNFVFGTYYNLTGLYRFQNGAALDQVWNNANIMNGIDLSDRSEFYIPLVQNEGNTQQLFTATQRVYRSDNAEAPVPADVQWRPISDDLTSGCTGSASNGGRACVISALGVSDGGTGGYAGTEEGWVWSADNATTSTGNANWVRNDAAGNVLPGRPVTSFAVDRSDWRTAFVSFAGYNPATPGHAGHVFKTTDGGQTWTNVTGNLPDNPVNSLELDPSDPNTVFAGTDVGSFVTHDGGTSWNLLGTGMPRVAIWQQSYDPSRGLLVAGTHGRGAWTLDTGIVSPAMVAQVSDPGTPVGPGSDIDYTITIRNVGDAAATNVVVTDPVPANTTADTVGDGGSVDQGVVTWTVPTIAAGDSVQLHLAVKIDPSLDPSVTQIVNDGLHVATDEGAATNGSPHVNPIAKQYQAEVSPASEIRTAQLTKVATFKYTVRNAGYSAEAFDLSLSGNSWASDILPDCSTSGTSTAVLAPGATQDVCVQVTVPADAAGHDQDAFTLTASPTDTSDASDDATADGTTIAVTNPVALVDDDGHTSGAADAQAAYKAALDADGVHYDVIDLATDALPDGYLTGYNEVYWFAGTSWPSPLAPYETGLKTYLDGGGKLFMSGLDILDQSAGNTPFASTYLHIDWNNATDNDLPTAAAHAVAGTPIGGATAADFPITVATDSSDPYCACLDELTPTAPAEAQFTADDTRPNGLAVTDTSPNTGTSYRVVFLAFPLERTGTATDQADIVSRVESYFNTP
jgi:uncharacterized repeat protein (TIGR01451 family)